MKITRKYPENLQEGEYILVASPDKNGPSIEAYDKDDFWGDVTEVIPGIPLGKDEIIINHDLVICSPDWVKYFLSEMCENSREIHFGMYNTTTIIAKLKKGWRRRCYSWKSFYGEE